MSDPSRPFRKQLDVLETSAVLRWLARALLVVGPTLFVAFLVQVFPPGVLGLHLTLLGFGLMAAVSVTNMRAKRRSAEVRASIEGVRVDGELVAPRARLQDGFFQPRWSREDGGYRSSVRLVDRFRRVAFEAEVAGEGEALAFLRALGLDPRSKRAEFLGSSPMFATLGRSLLFFLGGMASFVAFGAILAALQIPAFAPFPLVMMAIVIAGLVPSKIAVGIDGILLRWLWWKTFIPMSTITEIDREGDRILRIRRSNGPEHVVYTSMRRRSGPDSMAGRYAGLHRDAVLARMREAHEAFREQGPAADVAALVGRGARSREQWLESLAKLGAGEAGYRDAVVREDDLWRVALDPAAPEDARAGAVVALRPKLDDAGRHRVRVAAEATASPKLRVVLERASSESADLDEAVRDLVGDADDGSTHPATRAR